MSTKQTADRTLCRYPEFWSPNRTIHIRRLEDALESAEKRGRVVGLEKAICVVSSRLVPPKNPSYTRAIEESVVFLKAEIERKSDDFNVTTHHLESKK
jgi:hypothetical protein